MFPQYCWGYILIMHVNRRTALGLIAAAALPAAARADGKLRHNDRWLLWGDSIHTYAFESDGTFGNPGKLLASRAPSVVNVSIQNLSAGGNRACSGGHPGVGMEDHLATINGVLGGGNPQGILIALGTNDWASPAVSGIKFVQAYRKIVQHCAAGMKVVCVSPIWRHDYGKKNQKEDGAWALADYQDWVTSVAQEQGVQWIDSKLADLKPSHFADGVHLNGSGHIAVGDFIIKQMCELGHWQRQDES